MKVVSEPDLLDERGVSFPETPRSLRGHMKVCLLTKGHGSSVRSFTFNHYLFPGQTKQSTSSSATFHVEHVRTWFDAGTDLNGEHKENSLHPVHCVDFGWLTPFPGHALGVDHTWCIYIHV